MYNYPKTNKTISWHRFSGANYAAFQSLGKEIRIGVLTVAMLSSVSLKAEAIGTGNPSGDHRHVATDDTLTTHDLEDVEVLATRVALSATQTPRMVTVLRAQEIAAAAVHSVNDLLEYATGVDVRQRGEYGVQTDISVRGGNFDQITVLLNGVNISSPHTGHLTCDFPVTVQDIERIEVLEGPAARVFGTSAFTGVINIVTKNHHSRKGEVHAFGGSFGYAGGDLSYGPVSGGYSRSDGATPNSDFQAYRIFLNDSWNLGSKDNAPQLTYQFGYSFKEYGANTFYGASSTDQWESNERYIASVGLTYPIGKRWEVTANGNWNRWYDHYQWHRDVSPGGENFHRVDAYGGHLGVNYTTRYGKTSLGYEQRHEDIRSTSLGVLLPESDWMATGGHDADSDIKYKRRDGRTNHNLFLEHNVLLDQWTISLGILANNNSGLDSKWRLYPGVDVSFRPNADWKLFASWNMALRMPTYTDLYYSGTNIEGNSNLKPEKTMDVSLGARYRVHGWKAEAQLFYSHKTDMIDWVKYAESVISHNPSLDAATFYSTNFKLNNVGFEVSGEWLPQEQNPDLYLRKIGFSWSYLNQESDYQEAIAASKYAMMYLRHKLVATAESRLWRSLNASLSWRLMDRTGNANPSYALLDAKLSWDAPRFTIYADATNLLNKRYYEYEFIRQPGILFKAGVKVSF